MNTNWRCTLFGHRLDPDASYYYAIDHCTRCERDVRIGMLRIERIKVYALLARRLSLEWLLSRISFFRRCPECGLRWGRHDDKFDHLPF